MLEEMRRTMAFFEWEAGCWDGRSAQFTSDNPVLLEGYCAYTQWQATLQHALAVGCRELWTDVIALATCANGRDIRGLRECVHKDVRVS